MNPLVVGVAALAAIFYIAYGVVVVLHWFGIIKTEDDE